MRVKEDSEKASLKLNIKNTMIMQSSPITLWQLDGEKWKQQQISSSLALKLLWMVTVDMKSGDDCLLTGKLLQT